MGISSSKKKGAKKVGTGQISDLDKAVLKLKTQRRKVQAERERLDKVCDAHTDVAKRLLAEGRKDRALTAIKRKKLVEAQARTCDDWLLAVEGQLQNIETSVGQAGLMEALRIGVDAVKEIQKETSMEKVEALLEDTAEAAANAAAVDDALATALVDVDDDALAAELAELEDAALAQEMGEMPTAPKVPEEARLAAEAAAATAAGSELPDAPTHVASAKMAESEEEPTAVPA